MSLSPITSTPRVPESGWDRVGVWVSSVCAVHCLLMPLLLLALPFWPGAHVIHEAAHPVLAVALVPITLMAMRKSKEGVLWLLTGLGLVSIGLFAHDVLGSLSGSVLTLIGSMFLITGHRCNQTCCAAAEASSWRADKANGAHA